MASTHVNHNIYITEVQTGRCLHSLVGHRRTPWCVTFHPTIPGLVASGCLDGEVRIWDLHVSHLPCLAVCVCVCAHVCFVSGKGICVWFVSNCTVYESYWSELVFCVCPWNVLLLYCYYFAVHACTCECYCRV